MVLLPNPGHARLAELPIGNILAIAPAGCGKTEALAGRAHSVLKRGEVIPPKVILALTFSNKAKDNLASRVRSLIGAGWRQRICVTNFHGLSARIIRAHGNALGLPSDLLFPDQPWRNGVLTKLGISGKNRGAFERTLSEAKDGSFSDDQVMERLVESGHAGAVQYERLIRAEKRLDYDDLIRQGARLLAIPGVAALYRAHFGMVMVDEVQDLTVMQYEMVRAVGGDDVTYAGDRAQGIYTFAGADADGVFGRIKGLDPISIEFNLSYRSAPAVLAAVNAVALELNSTILECADASRWPDGGRVIYIETDDPAQEATTLLRYAIQLVENEPSATIGIIGRSIGRLEHVRRQAASAGVTFQDWRLATHVPRVVELLRHHVREATALSGSQDLMLDALERLCRREVESTDATTLDEIASACHVLRERLGDGVSLSEAVAGCRSSAAPDAPVSPGLHLLTGHNSKGQQFDWVFVLGLEEGHIPDFRNADDPEELRILLVMLSRAKSVLGFTYCRRKQTSYGWRNSNPSPWLPMLRSIETATDIT